MNSKQRCEQRKNDYILAMHDDGCTVEQIVREACRSLLHVKNVIYRYRT